jgi:hypothetical protein
LVSTRHKFYKKKKRDWYKQILPDSIICFYIIWTLIPYTNNILTRTYTVIYQILYLDINVSKYIYIYRKFCFSMNVIWTYIVYADCTSRQLHIFHFPSNISSYVHIDTHIYLFISKCIFILIYTSNVYE